MKTKKKKSLFCLILSKHNLLCLNTNENANASKKFIIAACWLKASETPNCVYFFPLLFRSRKNIYLLMCEILGCYLPFLKFIPGRFHSIIQFNNNTGNRNWNHASYGSNGSILQIIVQLVFTKLL